MKKINKFKAFDISKTGLKKETIDQVCNLFDKNSFVNEGVLYGSRAMGTFKHGSDIDLCLLGNKLDENSLFKLRYQLDELMLAYQFDLSIFHLIENEDLKEHICRVGMTFYKR